MIPGRRGELATSRTPWSSTFAFLSPRPNFALMTAADLLGMTLRELKRKIEDGVIVAVSTALGQRMAKEELMAAVLPEAIRLVELRAGAAVSAGDVAGAGAARGDVARCGVDARAGRRSVRACRGACGGDAGTGDGDGVAVALDLRIARPRLRTSASSADKTFIRR